MKMKKLTEADQKFVVEYNKIMHVLAILAGLVFTAATFGFYYGVIDLTPAGVVLDTFEQRIAFTLKYIGVQLAWIVLLMYYVIWQRLETPALDPTNGWEEHVQVAKNMLTNSIEHSAVFTFALLTMSIELDAVMVGRMVPGLTAIFMAGRVAFWLGYPRYRAFGFGLSNFPILVALSVNMYALYKLYF